LSKRKNRDHSMDFSRLSPLQRSNQRS